MFWFLFYKLFPGMRARATAKEAARRECRALRPGEPILGVAVCADEPRRYVVRVFCGVRRPAEELVRMPPWNECLIFAVTKNQFSVERLTGEEYAPTIR